MSKMNIVRGKKSMPTPFPVKNRSTRNMLKEGEHVISVHSQGPLHTCCEMLGELMRLAESKGWGDDWKFVSPMIGGVKYYAIKNK